MWEKKAWKMLRVRSQGLNRGFCGYTSNMSLAHTSISSELGLSASISVIPNSGVWVVFELAGKNSFSMRLFLIWMPESRHLHISPLTIHLVYMKCLQFVLQRLDISNQPSLMGIIFSIDFFMRLPHFLEFKIKHKSFLWAVFSIVFHNLLYIYTYIYILSLGRQLMTNKIQ